MGSAVFQSSTDTQSEIQVSILFIQLSQNDIAFLMTIALSNSSKLAAYLDGFWKYLALGLLLYCKFSSAISKTLSGICFLYRIGIIHAYMQYTHLQRRSLFSCRCHNKKNDYLSA